jgi:arylsulfatase A-like enzyme
MRHPLFHAVCALATVLITGVGTLSLDAAEKSPPNVLLIMVDDMGWSDLGCYGSEIDTPNLNRLAENGVRFTQFYNTAKCSQTRATLLSGCYHPEVRHTALRNCWTLGEAMRQSGYFTIMTGKWHLQKQPTDRGFDRYFGHLSGATNFFTGDKTFRLNGKPFAVPQKGFYTTDANTDYAISFMQESRKAEKPFFCYIAYNAPHYPLQAPEKDVRKYLGKYKGGWDELRKQRFAKQKKLGLLKPGWKLTPRPDDVRAWSKLGDKERREEDLRMAAYAAMIDRVDQNIGKLVSHLKSTKSLDNTLILFLSDNGACPFERTRDRSKMPWDPTSYWTYDKGWAHACNTPFREYKRNQHEGGISSPLIAHWPKGMKAKPGSITHQPGHLVDVMATYLDLTGTKYPAKFNGQTLNPLRGKSLLPILAGKTRQPHEAIFFDFTNRHQAVRMGNWKLVRINRGPWELYDMQADRSELNNLAARQPDRAARMQKAWESWAKQAGVGKKRGKKRGKKKKKKT